MITSETHKCQQQNSFVLAATNKAQKLQWEEWQKCECMGWNEGHFWKLHSPGQ